MKLKIKKIKKEAKLPCYAHPDDAGLDLFSCEDYLLLPHKRHLFKLGFATEFSHGYVGIIKDKSGLAIKDGLTVLAGVIDAGFRGEWGVILLNTSQKPYQVKKGDKIAQVIFQKIEKIEVEEVKKLSFHPRGEGGFGSTGKR